jgi:hypothetical protein
MKTEQTVHFRVHTPYLLKEIVENGLVKNAGVLKTPLNILRNYLGLVAQRAIEINDPQLNILMLEMALYDGTPAEIRVAIEEQKKLIQEAA